jgi:hypothetical protein
MAQLDPTRYKQLTGGKTYGQSDGLYWDTTNSQLCMVMGDAVVARVDATGITADAEYSGEARGDILRRNASSWGVLSAKTSGQMLIGDGTDVISAAMSGDATLSAAGALSLAVTQVKYVKVTATTGQLLAINATPKTIVAAPGAGFTTVIHRSLLVLNYNSAAYANNGVLGLYETNSAGALLTGTLTLASFLAQTADTMLELHPSAASATTGLTRLDNKAVVLTQAAGESITGNSPVDVHCWYSTVPNGL